MKIRQTVLTKASVEAKTSTVINKRLFFNEFHFEKATELLMTKTMLSQNLLHGCSILTPPLGGVNI